MNEIFSRHDDKHSVVAAQYREQIHVIDTDRSPFVDISKQSSPVLLAKGGSLTLDGASSTVIHCQRGSLWVTQNNDVRDVVIETGGQFRPDRKGPVVVYALAASRVAWEPVKLEAASPWKTLSSWLLQRLAVASRHPAIE